MASSGLISADPEVADLLMLGAWPTAVLKKKNTTNHSALLSFTPEMLPLLLCTPHVAATPRNFISV